MSTETRQQWEYANFWVSSVNDTIKVITINGQIQDPSGTERSSWQVLNQMGAEGWELVAIHAVVPPSPNAIAPRGVWEYVLKRPR